MGYFSNGTEGMMYEEHYCRVCIHYGPEEGPGCPIWAAHLLYAYDETDSGSNAEAMLDMFIPRGVIEDAGDGHPLPINEQCVMFVGLDGATPGQESLL